MKPQTNDELAAERDALFCPHGVVGGKGCEACDALTNTYKALRDRDTERIRADSAEAALVAANNRWAKLREYVVNHHQLCALSVPAETLAFMASLELTAEQIETARMRDAVLKAPSDISGTHGAETGVTPRPKSDWNRVAPSGGGSGHCCGLRGFAESGDTCSACDTTAVPVRGALDLARDGLASRERIRAESNPRRYHENALVVDNGEKGSAQKTSIGHVFGWDDLSALVLDCEGLRAEVARLTAERDRLDVELAGSGACVHALQRENERLTKELETRALLAATALAHEQAALRDEREAHAKTKAISDRQANAILAMHSTNMDLEHRALCAEADRRNEWERANRAGVALVQLESTHQAKLADLAFAEARADRAEAILREFNVWVSGEGTHDGGCRECAAKLSELERAN